MRVCASGTKPWVGLYASAATSFQSSTGLMRACGARWSLGMSAACKAADDDSATVAMHAMRSSRVPKARRRIGDVAMIQESFLVRHETLKKALIVSKPADGRQSRNRPETVGSCQSRR